MVVAQHLHKHISGGTETCRYIIFSNQGYDYLLATLIAQDVHLNCTDMGNLCNIGRNKESQDEFVAPFIIIY